MSELNKTAITPETKVARLLDSYPELEEVLIGLAPAFGKLRNPVLRKSIAKVATLRQAAKVGGISLGEMINTLRQKAGIEDRMVADSVEDTLSARPVWADSGRVAAELDARPLLEAGQHPLGQVLTALGELKPGEVFELQAPFTPIPLIDVVESKGYSAWWSEEGPDLVKVYIRSKPDNAEDSELTTLE